MSKGVIILSVRICMKNLWTTARPEFQSLREKGYSIKLKLCLNILLRIILNFQTGLLHHNGRLHIL